MNDKTASRRLVVASVLVMLGAVIARAVKGEVGQTFPRMWALAVVAVALGLISDFAPQIGGPLALLIALSYLNSGGRKAIGDAVQKATKSSKLASGISS